MHDRSTGIAELAAFAIGALALAGSTQAGPPTDFDREVKPLFARHCAACHGANKQKGGLRLDRKAEALTGGDSGKAIAPGKPGDSLLVKRIASTDPDERMPPKGEPLSAEQIATVRAWIEQGAKWPEDGSGANPANWWSFQPIRKPPLPAIKKGKFEIRNEIDRFILAKLNDKGLSPSPAADKRTLIRRVYYDLIGLPPSLDEIDAFLNDAAPDGYAKVVDRLLASPRYGERWARHWLDVVHFGETHGYDKDKPRPNAWPYRDYVIRSFNSDKPYNRFVQEQVAGDVLFPGSIDGIEALGFLAAGPWDFIGHAELPETKIDGKVARHLDRDDFVANTIGTFMSLTVHCAQCHNHKFDPITQEDYYRLQAVFAAIDRTDRSYDLDPAVAKKRAELEAKRSESKQAIAVLESVARKSAGKLLVDQERRIGEARQAAGGPLRPEYGYHSAIEADPGKQKWVQIDFGTTVKLDTIVLRACHDDFNGIGAGFGFPVRFKVELADDAGFVKGVVLVADRTGKDFANPATTSIPLKADGKPGRYLRVTATKLAPRQNDFIFALAEVEAFDVAGSNLAAGKSVTAHDSIEAPVRWR
jgi:mono/diheme cytochrome c family protein